MDDVNNRVPDLASSLVTSVANAAFRFLPTHSFYLFYRFAECMSGKFIAKAQGAHDYSPVCPRNGDFVAKLIFLPLLAFADALYLRFVQRVNLVPVVSLFLG